MTKLNQTPETKQDKNTQQKRELSAQTNEHLYRFSIPDDLPEQLIFSSYLQQANLLRNPNLPVIQRQAIATAIGRIQGNLHLQRVIAKSRHYTIQRYPDRALAQRIWERIQSGGLSVSVKDFKCFKSVLPEN